MRKEYMYEVGQVVNESLIIVNQIRNKRNSRAYVVQSIKYPTAPPYETSEGNLKKGIGDGYAAGQRIFEGNSLYSKIEVRKNIVNIEESKTISPYTHKKTLFKCSSCDYSKEVNVKNVTTHGFSCPLCKSYISYPEKVGVSVLATLNIKYDIQKTFDDCKYKNKLPFDFFIEHNGEKFCLEMNGLQHYEDCRMLSYARTRKTDQIKKEYCANNNIHYVAIDCRISDFDFIFDNLINSQIGFMLVGINKEETLDYLHSNFKYNSIEIIEMYKSGVKISNIAKQENITQTSVTGILKRAGVWEFTPHELRNIVSIECVTTGEIFTSQSVACKWCGLKRGGLNPHLKGRTKSAGRHPITNEKLTWKYVS